MPRHKKGDESVPKNSATAEQAAEIIEGIEGEKDALVALHMEYMRECQPLHERIKGFVDRGVKIYGMDRRAIQAKVKERGYRRKADEARAKLDAEEAEAFDLLSQQLGDLGSAARDSFYANRSDPMAGFAA